ncbi:MAG: aminotransferase DegT [Gemmatimonadetes bacterium]|nr:aminotransferase DegT [Gemmatimonadota bacterium]
MTETDGRKTIPIARPWIGEEEIEAVSRVLRSGWITQGPEVAKLEQEFALAIGADHACAVSNCTTALHLALLALEVGPGDEVITVSHSFIATANTVRMCGATPIFVDVEPATFNIDPERFEEALTDRTKAILCVHQMGMPCDLGAILRFSRRHSLGVIEDAACAIGSEVQVEERWERIGKPHGDLACFSFHPRKVVTAGEGGMITSSSGKLDDEIRLLRHQGMSISDAVRHESASVLVESYPVLGYNYRLTDIQAAVARVQLGRLPEIVEQRRRLGALYAAGLDRVPEVRAPHEADWARSNWQSYCVRLAGDLKQERVMQFLLDRGISTRRGIMCAHREDPYRSPPPRHTLTESERAQDRCILLPLYQEMSEGEIERVVDALAEAVGHSR